MFTPSRLLVVGGFVRDHLLHLPSKDIDFLLECSSFDELIANIKFIDPEANIRTDIWSNDAKFGRCIAGVHLNCLNWVQSLHSRDDVAKNRMIYCDFVIAREEGDYSDGRHPSFVKFSTFEKDLYRRDFTINSLAVDDATGEMLDLFGGKAHLDIRRLTTIRDPYTTFSEHIIRILRCLRLSITKRLYIDNEIWWDLNENQSHYRSLLMKDIFTNSIMNELKKMYKFDVLATNTLIEGLPQGIREGIFANIWLEPTNKQK